jgi:predicted DNA-binding WGR domain protein
MAYLEFEEGNSSKFWRIEQDGDSTNVTFGKIGTDGSTTHKEHGDSTVASKFVDKQIAAKKKKGYQEADDPSTGPPAKKKKTAAAAKKPAKAQAQAADALAGAVICITGTLSMGRKEMTVKLGGAGATVGGSVSAKTTHLLSTPSEVSSKTNKVIMAESKGLPVVSEAWVDASLTAGSLADVAPYLLVGAATQKPAKAAAGAKKPAAKVRSRMRLARPHAADASISTCGRKRRPPQPAHRQPRRPPLPALPPAQRRRGSTARSASPDSRFTWTTTRS